MRKASTAAAIAITVFLAGGVVAQGALAQLGLTEATARTFVLDEIKGPAKDRRSAIAVAGTRAFLKLPPSARGAAATGLFAWAKAYVRSPAFAASYASYRKGRTPTAKQYDLTVEEAVRKDLDEQLAGTEQLAQAAASMPPADRANILESVKKTRAMLTDPAFIKQRQDQLAAERAQESGGDAAVMSEVDALTPADPAKLFARRLREFLDATDDVNVSARTINLTISPVASTASSSWTRPTGRGTGCGRKPRSFSIFIRTSPGLWLDCRGEVCLNARRVSNRWANNRWARTSPPGFVPRPATPMRSPV